MASNISTWSGLQSVARLQGLSQGRDLSLDIIRGMAILLAMGDHINHADSGPLLNLLQAPAARIGWAGVDLFFVLSGFLIGGMIIKEARTTGGFDYKRFLVRRMFRLWPALYTFLFAMLLFGFPARDFFWQIALHIQGYAEFKSATHLWSLAVEEQFYLILGLGFPLLSLAFDWRRALPFILIGIIILCPMFRAVASWGGVSHRDIHILTHFRIDALACGVLIAFLALERPELFSRYLALPLVWVAIALLGVAFLWIVPRQSHLGETMGYSASWIASAAILFLVYKRPIAAPLQWPGQVLAFLGQISYPLYLWHVAVLRLGERHLPRFIGEGHGALQTLLIYVGAIAVALSVTIFVERPAMRYRDRIFPPPVKAPVADLA